MSNYSYIRLTNAANRLSPKNGAQAISFAAIFATAYNVDISAVGLPEITVVHDAYREIRFSLLHDLGRIAFAICQELYEHPDVCNNEPPASLAAARLVLPAAGRPASGFYFPNGRKNDLVALAFNQRTSNIRAGLDYEAGQALDRLVASGTMSAAAREEIEALFTQRTGLGRPPLNN